MCVSMGGVHTYVCMYVYMIVGTVHTYICMYDCRYICACECIYIHHYTCILLILSHGHFIIINAAWI